MPPSFIPWLAAILILLAAGWFIGKTLHARWLVRQQAAERQRVEDALKLIFNLGQEGQTTDQYRLAVELRMPLARAQTLISSLQAQELISPVAGRHLTLTAEGRKWALQVIRAHRLWERYLADEARMPLEQVHTAAHHREHEMTAAEVDALDADLGYPTRDPHGDPIPDAAGNLRRDDLSSTPLLKLEPGQRGQISHLEDEPPLAYAQLLAEGLFVGQPVEVVENTAARVVLGSAEGEYTLAPSIAENVYIQLEAPRERADPEVVPLGALAPRAEAEIVRIDDRVQGFTRRRFLDLGLTPGAVIYPELENIFRDPRAYRVRGTLIALRKDQAGMIWVKPQDGMGP